MTLHFPTFFFPHEEVSWSQTLPCKTTVFPEEYTGRAIACTGALKLKLAGISTVEVLDIWPSGRSLNTFLTVLTKGQQVPPRKIGRRWWHGVKKPEPLLSACHSTWTQELRNAVKQPWAGLGTQSQQWQCLRQNALQFQETTPQMNFCKNL